MQDFEGVFRQLRPCNIGRREFLRGAAVVAAATALPLPLDAAAAFKSTWANQYTYVAPDLRKTVDWYVEVFGMQEDRAGANEVHLWYGDDGGDTVMIVRQAAAGEAAPRIEKFGFTLDNWDKNAVASELQGRGLRPTPEGDTGFWFTDPAGNEIGVFASDFMRRPSAPAVDPMLWKAVSANHIVVLTEDYTKLADWYRELLDLRQTRNSGRDTYQWFGDSVWIPTNLREGGQTSAALGTLDHIAYTITEFDKDSVEAELARRNLEPRLDTDYSFNCVDINGFKTQVCDRELVIFAEQRPPRGRGGA